jgi:hypothetical protein
MLFNAAVQENYDIDTCTALFALVTVPAMAQAPPPSTVAAPARVKSPEVSGENMITFRLIAPAATTVTLNGNWPGVTDLP